LRVEQLGSVYWLSWYADQPPSSEEWLSLESLLKECNWQKWYLQVRGDRGRAPNQELVRLSTEAPPIRWTAKENGLVFSFRRDSGLSPGLFLDQRRNRSWVLNNSNGSKVLNLFCYTGGFSVCAAAGGAQKVVSVDLSRPFLDRAKENFALNSLSSTDHEFRAIDSREYLAWAAKKKLLFDLVICDPPSFGRSKSGVFRFERDFNGLIRQLAAVTAPGGVILFATNFEGWDIDTFTERASCGLETHSMAIRPTPSPDLDFELPRQNRNMKSAFFVSRKSDPGS
jgi:23S rRNA (cytosine1962-C5)-methyltransferase